MSQTRQCSGRALPAVVEGAPEAVVAFADPDFPPPPPPLSVWEQTLHSWPDLPDEIPHFLRGRTAT